MEPVPESERMEEFRSSPLPTLRLQNASSSTSASSASTASSSSSASFTLASPTPLPPRFAIDPDDSPRKSLNMRRSTTDPLSPSSPAWGSPSALPYRPRTASPLSGAHTRSRSSSGSGSLFPPAMGRTRSMPGVNGSGHIQYAMLPRSSSPSSHRPPAILTRTPKKAIFEDVFPSSPTRISVIHDPDHRLQERNSSPNLGLYSPTGAVAPAMASLPMVRTRPSSPFRRLAAAAATTGSSAGIGSIGGGGSAAAPPSTAGSACSEGSSTPASSTVSSPSYRPYDSSSLSVSSYGLGALSSSSVPSTPTSTRSRSPSISSLETIPDSPDAEEAALEAERIAQLKAAADAAESGDAKGRSSLDVPTRGRTLGFGSRDKRKRWSVCGAERRGDLDLETIWED